MKYLTIIIPVYNVASYLNKCLDSVFQQDIPYEDYEVIIVNDGSTDNSAEIAIEYKRIYPNLKLINQKNMGLGGARNTGMVNASGKYLMFVDSDDYIEKNSLKFLIEKVEFEKLDILRFNHQEVDETYLPLKKSKNAVKATDFDDKIVDGLTYLTKKMGWACYVCVYLLRTDFLKQTACNFKNNIYFEDVHWLPGVLVQAEKVQSINILVYNYLRRSNSITKGIGKEKQEKILRDKLYMIKSLQDFSKITSDLRVTKWCDGLIALSIIGIMNLVNRKLLYKKLETVSSLKKLKIFPLMLHHKFTIQQKIKVFYLNFNCVFIRQSIRGILLKIFNLNL